MIIVTLETTQPISEKEPRVLGYMMIRKTYFSPYIKTLGGHFTTDGFRYLPDGFFVVAVTRRGWTK